MDGELLADSTSAPAAQAGALMNRRQALYRAAVVGGALVWAAPSVQHLARGMAHAEVSPIDEGPPPPPPPAPAPQYHGVSYVGFVFTCEGVLYKAKWERSADTFVDAGNLPHCTAPAGWGTAVKLAGPSHKNVPGKGDILFATSFGDGELYSVTFTLPAGCSVSDGAGVAMGGGGGRTDSGYCVGGTVTAPNEITFTAEES